MRIQEQKKIDKRNINPLKQDSYRQYNLLFGVSLFSSLALVFAVNCFVDPYNILPDSKQSELFQNKPDLEKHIRLSKYMQISYLKPNILLLGSSRIAGGMKITEKVLGMNQVIYNLGIPGAHIDELKYYLQYAINNDTDHTLNRVILGIDFFMFKTQYNKETDQIKAKYNRRPNILDYTSTYLSLDSLSSTASTFNTNFFSKNSHSPKHRPIKGRFIMWLEGFYRYWYNDYFLSNEKLNDLKEIVELCKKNNIKLDIFISPIHATHNQVINGRNLWPIYEQWKREVVKITPVWDFSDFNSITTETISEQMKFYVDNSHYTPLVGDMIERRMSGRKGNIIPKNFGVLIDQDNVESHLKQIRLHRQNWIKNFPRDRQFVDDIVRKLKNKSP